VGEDTEEGKPRPSADFKLLINPTLSLLHTQTQLLCGFIYLFILAEL
jgi:hypothetical protein